MQHSPGMRMVITLLLAVLALSSAAACQPVAPPPPYHALTREFARFYDETAAMPDEQRVALFRERFDALFPGFYEPMGGQTDAQFDRTVQAAFRNFPVIRARYEQAERDFPAAYAAGIAHFRTSFPGFRMTMPVWFVHSLGRMDGGTRTIRSSNMMIFGADQIGTLHNSRDIGPFLDHEMLHVENSRWFPDCTPDTTVWCALWQEGLATYVSGTMNHTTDDALLMLNFPAPIRPAVDADPGGALCLLRGDLDKSDNATYALYFMDGGSRHPYPARFGYYLGYRLMQRLGRRYTLAQLDRMGHDEAHRLLVPELDTMVREAGSCAH